MIVFPNCKINLGLNILRKRPDAFHDLQTVFYPVPLTDALEIIQEPNPSADIAYTSSGLSVDGALSDNICSKAYHLIKSDFPHLPPVAMHLHKNIPMGAGLGGGSADGAFTLLLLNKKFNLELSDKKLMQYALQLGSDCPFFIRNSPSYATGRGDALQPIELDLSAYTLFMVNPGVHINTGWAFSQILPGDQHENLQQLLTQKPEHWKGRLTNDFEEAVFAKHPVIAACKTALYQAGAVYASMSGTGATVYGLFRKQNFSLPLFPDGYFVKVI